MDREAFASDLGDDRRLGFFFWRYRKRQHVVLGVVHRTSHASRLGQKQVSALSVGVRFLRSMQVQKERLFGAVPRCGRVPQSKALQHDYKSLRRRKAKFDGKAPEIRIGCHRESCKYFRFALTEVRLTSGEPLVFFRTLSARCFTAISLSTGLLAPSGRLRHGLGVSAADSPDLRSRQRWHS